MELRSYLVEQSLTCEGFAKLVGVTERAVIKWRRGERIPRPEHIKKINKVTAGAVGPNDFFDVEAA
jgi:transcriptional regulator with XRE-family HTH domain